jgi:ElaB/YqjD/DUF883 family membrane-anchored ribosome-binding protein
MAFAERIDNTFNSKQTSDNKGTCAMADVKDQAKDKIEEGTNRAKKTVDAAVDKAADISSSARDYAQQAVDKAREGYQEVADRSQEVVRQADHAVRENPHLSIGAALGAGFFVGLLVGFAARSGRS